MGLYTSIKYQHDDATKHIFTENRNFYKLSNIKSHVCLILEQISIINEKPATFL